jgi:hypothetical protein
VKLLKGRITSDCIIPGFIMLPLRAIFRIISEGLSILGKKRYPSAIRAKTRKDITITFGLSFYGNSGFTLITSFGPSPPC